MDLTGVESLLHSIFLVLAVRAGTHWELSPEEATQLSKAVANVVRHYPVAKTQKAADWSQLLLIVLVLGIPRAVQSYSTPAATPARPLPQGQNAPQPARPAVMTPSAPPVAPGVSAALGGRPVTPGELDPGSMIASHLTAGTA